MKERHAKSAGFHARETLRMCRVSVGADFHTLSTSQVESLIAAADQAKYRKPKNANGSRARYFHDLMQRRARAIRN